MYFFPFGRDYLILDKNMLKEKMIEKIKSTYPNKGFLFPNDVRSIAEIESPNKEIGKIIFYDDGDEVTMLVGDITHSHFSEYDETSVDKKSDLIIERVFYFLDDLFEGKVLFNKDKSGRSGGWKTFDSEADLDSFERSVNSNYYTWS